MHDFNTPRVKGILLICFLIYLILVGGLSYAWYSEQLSSGFHFFNDAAEWKQMDKFAHFFWTFQVCALATRLLTWAKLPDKKAVLTGSCMGFIFVSSVEIGDGLSLDYGASVYDLLANGAGCAAFFGQRLFLGSLKIWPKFSFHSTVFAPLRPEMLGNNLFTEMLKDYNGQTFWYSAQFKFLPLPNWLTLAVGVGAEGMVYGRDAENEAMQFSPYRKYFLSFDINLSAIKTTSRLLQSALYIFNIIKIPAHPPPLSTLLITFHPLSF